MEEKTSKVAPGGIEPKKGDPAAKKPALRRVRAALRPNDETKKSGNWTGVAALVESETGLRVHKDPKVFVEDPTVAWPLYQFRAGIGTCVSPRAFAALIRSAHAVFDWIDGHDPGDGPFVGPGGKK